jgi:hypothetical protein
VSKFMPVRNRLRFMGYALAAGMVLVPGGMVWRCSALLLLLLAELLERLIFFRAAAAPVMPGWKPRSSH